MLSREIFNLPLTPAGQGGMRGKGGFVLFLSLVVMIALTVIGGGLAVLLATNYRNAAIQANDAKAFWLAEAGIADGTKQLIRGDIVLADGESATIGTEGSPNSLGDGVYWVSLSRSGNDVTVTSNGKVNNQQRQVQIVLTSRFPVAFNYAVFGSNTNDKTLSIGENNAATVSISGDLFYDATTGTDTVRVRDNSEVINGLVYADAVIGGGTYTPATSDPSPIPKYPNFTSTFYDDAIADAQANASSNLVLSGTSNLNLSGGTVYYKLVTVKDSASITGPGTIVSTRAFDVKNSASIGSNVTIIVEDTITFENNATVSSGGRVYATNNILLHDDVVVSSILLAPNAGKKIRIHNNAQFTGILYTNTADILNNAVITGSIVANQFTNNNIADNAHVTFDANVIPTAVTGIVEEFTQKADSWNETT